MLLLQTDVLGGNKLNCFKATQVLGGLTQILIWGSGFPIVEGGHEGGAPPYLMIFLETPPPPKLMPPWGAPHPLPLKNKAQPLKHETPFDEMIPRKSTINNNLKSS